MLLQRGIVEFERRITPIVRELRSEGKLAIEVKRRGKTNPLPLVDMQSVLTILSVSKTDPVFLKAMQARELSKGFAAKYLGLKGGDAGGSTRLVRTH